MRIKIGTKLFLGFGLVILMAILITGIAFIELQKIDNSYSVLVDEEMEKRIVTKNLLVQAHTMISAVRGYLFSKNPKYLQQWEQGKKELEGAITSAQALINKPEGEKMLETIENSAAAYIENADKTVVFFQKGQDFSKPLVLGTNAVAEMIDTTVKLEKFQEQQGEIGHEAVKETVAAIKRIVLTIAFVLVAVAIIIAVIIARNISKPLVLIEDSARSIANGDLSKEKLIVRNQDELGDLAKSFNLMVQNLRNLLSEVNEASQHLASSSQQLSASAEQTSTAAMESANTITEMSNGVQQIASNSQEVAQASIETNKLAEQGGTGVQEGINQMERIKETVDNSAEVIRELGGKSKSIGQIVDLITQIADQTNLLALNAAIEAARAGEQGKGFAVVAEEVRKLAEQSANAAKEITDLISEIQHDTENAVQAMQAGTDEVNNGSIVLNNLGSHFNNILKTVRDLTYRVQEVSAASQQMAASVENVAAVTEEQTASMEEVTASSESLNKMAENLQSLVGKFKLS